jgi:hypothetical protein
MEDDALEEMECAEYGFGPRPGFSTSQDDLGKTKTSGQDLDKVLLV